MPNEVFEVDNVLFCKMGLKIVHHMMDNILYMLL